LNLMNCRTYGQTPFLAVVVHGGPGAPGSVSSLARMLSSTMSVLEPFQNASTVGKQVDELAEQIRMQAREPVFLFGHSWGAWLSLLVVYNHPELVGKVFLIGSGAFDPAYIVEMENRRLCHLTETEGAEYKAIGLKLTNSNVADKDALLERLGCLAAKADDFQVDQTPENREDLLKVDGCQYQKVWAEAAHLRETGHFARIADQIKVPVRIIHGTEDPTPIDGVVEPLRRRVRDLVWYELERCGHSPWKERYAQDEFFRILKAEIFNGITHNKSLELSP
jgi:pimeloyl-ACP methyl ester carboxylesterase